MSAMRRPIEAIAARTRAATQNHHAELIGDTR